MIFDGKGKTSFGPGFQHFVELLVVTTKKELQTRYRYTVFGFFWIVLIPVLQMAVIGFIFTAFAKEPIPDYYAFLYTGLLIWNFFSLSLSKATPSIVYERDMVTRAKFPRSIIPLSIIASNLVHFLLGLFLVMVILAPSGRLTVAGGIGLIMATIWLVILTVGVSLFSTALNVRYRDINFFIQAGLILWFYATPVVYPLSFINSSLQWAWRLNPMTAVVQLYHWSLLGFAFPGTDILLTNALITLLLFIIGTAVFGNDSKNFADWV